MKILCSTNYLKIYRALIVGHQVIYDVTKNSWTQKPCSYILSASKCGIVWLLVNCFHTITSFKRKEFLKTLWEKEKMLVTSIFSFSKNVFYPIKVRFPCFSNILFCLQMSSIPTTLKFCHLSKNLTLSQITNFRLFQTERLCRQFQI